MKYDIGVIVGRFQVDELHVAHEKYIETVMDNHDKTIIFVGVSPTLGTKNNPLDFSSRKGLFKQYENADLHVLPLPDMKTDEEWSDNLDKLVRTIYPLGKVCLYGGRDSFIGHYKGIFPVQKLELDIDPKISGTLIRESLGKNVIDDSLHRAGQIYATQNTYPRVYPCVDIAVIRKEGKNLRVAMGIRSDSVNARFSFPGGFVDPTDTSYEDAAVREMTEEIGPIEVDTRSVEYIGSFKIEDWRYRSCEEKIITSFYSVPYVFGALTPSKEMPVVEWKDITEKTLDKVSDSHQSLFYALLLTT